MNKKPISEVYFLLVNYIRRKFIYLLLMFTLIPVIAYSSSINNSDISKIKRESFNIIRQDYNELPYTYYKEETFDTTYISDKDGIILFEWKGSKYYHPVNMVYKALGYLDLYVQTQKQNYLAKIQMYANKFIEIADTVNGALYFAYKFDYPLHGDTLDILQAPWYSAMAQGKILSFFVRLYEITNEQRYFTISKLIYNSFRQIKDTSDVWIAMIDSNGYYWLELYPDDPPTHVLNGFMFSLIGLYDYLRLTSDPECKFLLQAALTTLKGNVLLYRRPGKISYYCLKHKYISKKYHKITVSYLYEMYKITGDYFFHDMHILFRDDYN